MIKELQQLKQENADLKKQLEEKINNKNEKKTVEEINKDMKLEKKGKMEKNISGKDQNENKIDMKKNKGDVGGGGNKFREDYDL